VRPRCFRLERYFISLLGDFGIKLPASIAGTHWETNSSFTRTIGRTRPRSFPSSSLLELILQPCLTPTVYLSCSAFSRLSFALWC
jgi:hypothetical protein